MSIWSNIFIWNFKMTMQSPDHNGGEAVDDPSSWTHQPRWPTRPVYRLPNALLLMLFPGLATRLDVKLTRRQTTAPWTTWTTCTKWIRYDKIRSDTTTIRRFRTSWSSLILARMSWIFACNWGFDYVKLKVDLFLNREWTMLIIRYYSYHYPFLL